jgi:hypothetical protein
VALLLADVSPNLVNLDTAAGKLAHLLIHEPCATVADFDQQPTDCVAVRARHPFGAADRVALDQAIDDLGAAAEWHAIHAISPTTGTIVYSSDIRIKKNSLRCMSIVDTFLAAFWRLPMKTENILVRAQPDEKLAFQQAADLAGISLSAWIRERLRLAAIRELEGAGRAIPFVSQIPLRNVNG